MTFKLYKDTFYFLSNRLFSTRCYLFCMIYCRFIKFKNKWCFWVFTFIADTVHCFIVMFYCINLISLFCPRIILRWYPISSFNLSNLSIDNFPLFPQCLLIYICMNDIAQTWIVLERASLWLVSGSCIIVAGLLPDYTHLQYDGFRWRSWKCSPFRRSWCHSMFLVGVHISSALFLCVFLISSIYMLSVLFGSVHCVCRSS